MLVTTRIFPHLRILTHRKCALTVIGAYKEMWLCPCSVCSLKVLDSILRNLCTCQAAVCPAAQSDLCLLLSRNSSRVSDSMMVTRGAADVDNSLSGVTGSMSPQMNVDEPTDEYELIPNEASHNYVCYRRTYLYNVSCRWEWILFLWAKPHLPLPWRKTSSPPRPSGFVMSQQSVSEKMTGYSVIM